jgi:hypothetical protein
MSYVQCPMTYNEFKAHASTHISNTGGIEIMIHPSGDGLYYRFVPDRDEEVFEAEIQYKDDEDDPNNTIAYFMHGECEYRLDEFMRHDAF